MHQEIIFVIIIIMESIYKGTASLGRFKGKVIFYVMLILTIVVVAFAIYYFFKNDTNLVNTNATIKTVDCKPFIDKQGTTYDCLLGIHYKIDDKDYDATISTYRNSVNYFVNQTIEITYDKTNPANVMIKRLSNKMIALILIGVGAVALGIGYFSKYMTEHFEVYAAAKGMGTVLSVVSMPFR